MNTTWPEALSLFESFARTRGLTLVERKEDAVAFGNKVVVMGNDRLYVRLVLDRGICGADVAEAAATPKKWYSVVILRDLLEGVGDDSLSLPEQINVLERNWETLMDSFSAGNRNNTYEKLVVVRNARGRRLFPKLYGDNT